MRLIRARVILQREKDQRTLDETKTQGRDSGNSVCVLEI